MWLRKLCRAILRCCAPIQPRRRREFPRYVVFHLKQRSAARVDAVAQPEDGLPEEVWQGLVKRYPGIRQRAFFDREAQKRLRPFIDWVVRRNPGVYRDPGFFAYHRILGPDGTDFAAIARHLLETGVADVAYVEQPAEAPVDRTGQILSEHHRPSPVPQMGPTFNDSGGIGMDPEWDIKARYPGCAGKGVYFVDVERGWDLSHPDLPAYLRLSDALLSGVNDPDWEARNHGTSALGVICAQEGPHRPGSGIGIAPYVERGWVSSWFEGYVGGKEVANYPAAIAAAALKLALNRGEGNLPPADPPIGDVIVIQAQVEDLREPGHMLPLEAKKLNFDAIQLATAAGIIVVEAGGNGDQSSWRFDSEAWPPSDPASDGWDPTNAHPLSPTLGNPPMDSGAILVSAATYSGAQITPFDWYPRGKRIDCFAWEFGAHTCAAPDGYDVSWGGTSAATAIVAGAAMVLQGIARQTHPQNRPLSPNQMREAFRQKDWNTWPSIDPYDTEQPQPQRYKIGYMPRFEELAPRCANGVLHTLPPYGAVQPSSGGPS